MSKFLAKKYESKSRKTPFSEHFGTKLAQNWPKNFSEKNEHHHILTSFVLHLHAKNQEKLMIKSGENQENTKFRPFLDRNWPKTGKKIFSEKNEHHHILTSLLLHLHAKNQEKLIIKSGENHEKPNFRAFLGPNWPTMWTKKIFRNKWTPSHLNIFASSSSCKKSGKTTVVSR